MRDLFRERRLLARVVPDLEYILGFRTAAARASAIGASGDAEAPAPAPPVAESVAVAGMGAAAGNAGPADYDADAAAPGPLWAPSPGANEPVWIKPDNQGGRNWADPAAPGAAVRAPTPDKDELPW